MKPLPKGAWKKSAKVRDSDGYGSDDPGVTVSGSMGQIRDSSGDGVPHDGRRHQGGRQHRGEGSEALGREGEKELN